MCTRRQFPKHRNKKAYIQLRCGLLVGNLPILIHMMEKLGLFAGALLGVPITHCQYGRTRRKRLWICGYEKIFALPLLPRLVCFNGVGTMCQAHSNLFLWTPSDNLDRNLATVGVSVRVTIPPLLQITPDMVLAAHYALKLG